MADGLDAIGSIIDIGTGLFGTAGTTEGTTSGTATSVTDAIVDVFGTSTTTGEVTGTDIKKLVIDPEAITRIIQEVLGGTSGLASIFAGEKTAGVFDSTTATQQAGDLVARLVGEIAKLTAEEVTTTDRAQTETEDQVQRQTQQQAVTQTQETAAQQRQEEQGLIETIGDFLGF